MDELAYRIRAAEPDDLAAVRNTIKVSLAHPEGRGRGTSLRTALQRNELLLLDRYDTREKDWVIGGFVEFQLGDLPGQPAAAAKELDRQPPGMTSDQ